MEGKEFNIVFVWFIEDIYSGLFIALLFSVKVKICLPAICKLPALAICKLPALAYFYRQYQYVMLFRRLTH
jgi:hypothetical protein